MGKERSGTKECFTSIYVVCEGSKSEPWFLRRFIECVAQRFGINYDVTIYPTPQSQTEELEDDMLKSKVRRKNHRKTSGRHIIGGSDVEPLKRTETPQGGNPLYWVRHGKEKLSSFSEVFVVFDKDGHPKMKEAFEEAAMPDSNGKKVTVILNSRSFEYYMLLHFERIYRAFEKTECGEKDKATHHTRYFRCCLPSAVVGKACYGNVCINGYARRNGYWSDSKDEHTFVSATNIWRGVENGEYVRNLALNQNQGMLVYELNPYVEFQDILARLMEMRILRDGDIISRDCGRHETQSIIRDKDTLIIENGSSILSLSLNDGWLEYFFYPEEIIRYEDFNHDSLSIEEREKAYSDIQFMRTSIRTEESVRVSQESRHTFSLFSSEGNNIFAMLKFDGCCYLIFRMVY